MRSLPRVLVERNKHSRLHRARARRRSLGKGGCVAGSRGARGHTGCTGEMHRFVKVYVLREKTVEARSESYF